MDPVSGSAYYCNRDTGESSWEPPAHAAGPSSSSRGARDPAAEASWVCPRPLCKAVNYRGKYCKTCSLHRVFG